MSPKKITIRSKKVRAIINGKYIAKIKASEMEVTDQTSDRFEEETKDKMAIMLAALNIMIPKNK